MKGMYLYMYSNKDKIMYKKCIYLMNSHMNCIYSNKDSICNYWNKNWNNSFKYKNNSKDTIY